MIYNQYPYGIYNPTYLTPNYMQQLEIQRQQQEYWKQQKKIADMVKAISDYFEAARAITDPELQKQATLACSFELARQAAISMQQNGGQQ